MRSFIACSMAVLVALAITTPLLAEVDVNTASAEELKSISGIGDAIAAKIIAYRDEHGPFQSINDVGKIKGIGHGKRLQNLIAAGLVCNPMASE